MNLFLSLLALLPHVGVVAAVAYCHSDRDKDHRPRENCTAAGFSDVPAGIKPTTKVLLFPRNLFSSLSWSSFQIFTDIYEIDLTGNKVPEVTSSVSLILPSLRVLRLGSNRLTSLSDGSFSACLGLTELYLDDNAIDSLSDHTFSGLSKLEILELSSNQIKVLPELMLHPLTAIETLYLENNKIKVMPDGWFSKKKEVPYLYLSANPWACSCSLDYLRRYLDEYEFNIYVRDGPDIKSDGESVVCDSPQWHKGKPVMSLEESDFCSSVTLSGPTGDNEPMITNTPYEITTAPTTTTTTTAYIPTTAAPIPTTTAYIPTTAAPIPTTAAPIPTTAAHIPTTAAHIPTTAAYIPTTAAPTPTPIPTTTAPIPTPPPPIPTTAVPAPTSPAFIEELHTEYHRVVTWSWYQTFTRFIEWSEHSGSGASESNTLTIQATLPTIRRSTKRPAKPVTTTKSAPSTVTSTTPRLQVTTTTTIPSWVIDKPGSQRRGAVGGAGVFCFWLFAGCLLLCVASAVCILATLARLVMWYRRVYKPLTRRGRGRVGTRLLTYSRREEEAVTGGGGGGVAALYRSVLFIQKEAGEAMDGGEEGEGGGEGGKERVLVTLEPAEGGGGGAMREEGEREERGVYRKTLYRLLSKEEEIEGWRDVMEECQISAEDGGRRGEGKDEGMNRERSGGGLSRKRYSVILREERAESGGGGEEMDWVVGRWEEPRSSWGEWLAHLPSTPWGVTTPPEGPGSEK